jgi:hypothetical protein
MAEPQAPSQNVPSQLLPKQLLGAIILGSLSAGIASGVFSASPAVSAIIGAGVTLLGALGNRLAAPNCKQCGKPVSTARTEALGAVWHPECFLCVKCQIPLLGQFYHVRSHSFWRKCSVRVPLRTFFFRRKFATRGLTRSFLFDLG